MSKPSRGGTRSAPAKKKVAKRREELQSVAPATPSAAATAPVQPEAAPTTRAAAPALQFRPKGREGALRANAGKLNAAARANLQPVDYSYVFTDLKIIGTLTGSLLAALIALSFVIVH
ncbi:MAG TPA: hypothetical protein VHS28_00235 [Chloroflexota bacterium]|nr:hypothetical protein [Chloroflexota bacterium]